MRYVYVKPFGKFKAGDFVELPDNARVPSEFLRAMPEEPAVVDSADDDVKEDK